MIPKLQFWALLIILFLSYYFHSSPTNQYIRVGHIRRAGLKKILNWLGTDQKRLPCAISRNIFKKKNIYLQFSNYYHGFYGCFLAFRPIWPAISISHNLFWLVDNFSEAISAAKISNWLGTHSHRSHTSAGEIHLVPHKPYFTGRYK